MLDRAGLFHGPASGRCGRSSSAASDWRGSSSRPPASRSRACCSSPRAAWLFARRRRLGLAGGLVADHRDRPRPHHRPQRRRRGGAWHAPDARLCRPASRLTSVEPAPDRRPGLWRGWRSSASGSRSSWRCRCRALRRHRSSSTEHASSNRVHVVSVMGRAEHISRATDLSTAPTSPT